MSKYLGKTNRFTEIARDSNLLSALGNFEIPILAGETDSTCRDHPDCHLRLKCAQFIHPGFCRVSEILCCGSIQRTLSDFANFQKTESIEPRLSRKLEKWLSKYFAQSISQMARVGLTTRVNSLHSFVNGRLKPLMLALNADNNKPTKPPP